MENKIKTKTHFEPKKMHQILVCLSLSQLLHKGFCRDIIDGVYRQLQQHLIFCVDLHFLNLFLVLTFQNIVVEVYHSKFDHLHKPWKVCLKWHDGKAFLFWLASFNHCHFNFPSVTSNLLVIIFLRLIPETKSLVCTFNFIKLTHSNILILGSYQKGIPCFRKQLTTIIITSKIFSLLSIMPSGTHSTFMIFKA